MTSKELAADKRLRRTYGISLAEYNRMLADQNYVCLICRRPPSPKMRLAVDHCHRFDRIAIKVTRDKATKTYSAEATNPLLGINLQLHGKRTRAEAKREMKLLLRRRSLRGLLCFRCNYGLRFYYDRPERFEAAAKYLRKFNACVSETSAYPAISSS